MIKKRLVLTFPSSLVDQPITYQLVKKYDLMVNILRAQITPQESGKLTVEVSGSRKNLDRGMEFLSELGVGVRILSRGVRWDEARCIECTACASICPTGALSVSRPEMRFAFDKAKCIACEICIPACPYAALEIEPETGG
jgi:L-aspartate semialdehyde sulfurtransferase ferredoxin